MEITVFEHYKVHYKCAYTSTNEVGEYVEKEEQSELNIDGKSLLKMINSAMQSNNCFSVLLFDNEIHISHFNPNTGEDAHHNFKWKEIK